MKHFILLAALVALSHAQVLSTEGPSQIIGVPGPRWQGPLANHILGQPVGDTAEVAAAKAAHYKAHAQILEILPSLPVEDSYTTATVIQPQQQTLVNLPQHSSFVVHQPSQVPQQVYVPAQVSVPSSASVVYQPVQTNPELVQFSAGIPWNGLGETPEVAAARKAHLAAYAEIEKRLPKLSETTPTSPEAHQTEVVGQYQEFNQQPQVVFQQPQVLYQQPQAVHQESGVQAPVILQPVQTASQLAEEIPRSELGETPEVAAARKAHLTAYAEIEKLLPKLEETTTTLPAAQQSEVVSEYQILNQQPQVVNQQLVYQQPQALYQETVVGDTPEVAAARKAHLAAYAEIEKLLPKLEETTTTVPAVQQSEVVGQYQILNQQPQAVYQQTVVSETPEVAAARKAHLAAYAEIEKLLPILEESTTNVPAVQQPEVVGHFQILNQQPQVVYQGSESQIPLVLQPVQTGSQFVQLAEEIPRSKLGEVPEVAAARKAHLAAYAEIEKSLSKLQETTTTVPTVQQPQVVGNFQVLTQQPQLVYQQPQVVFQQLREAPTVVPGVQQPQSVNQQSRAVYQQSQNVDQDSQLWKQQLQRNLEWFYNPQQFYSYVPQDTPEVAAAKAEHLKLLQQLN